MPTPWSLRRMNTGFSTFLGCTRLVRRQNILSDQLAFFQERFRKGHHLIYPRLYFLYVMKNRICLGKGVFRPTSKIFLSAFPAELL